MKKFALLCFVSVAMFSAVALFMRKKEGSKHVALVSETAPRQEVIEGAVPGIELDLVKDELSEQKVDHIHRFFVTGKEQFPIVQTVKYKSRVPWLKGKQAWIADYASYYKTSRHFIARSLNKTKDYFTQKARVGDTFTVFHPEKKVNFYLVIDLSRCKMWFYYHDLTADEKVLVKTYKVGVGRFDSQMDSGVLTPTGQYVLGDKVAMYKPNVMGYFQGVKTEMVQIFGTRWIPLAREVESGDEVRGYGLHGVPWIYNEKTKTYSEDPTVIGKYTSDGCIRLAQDDIEEIYAIVLTKNTIVEIVTDFSDSKLLKSAPNSSHLSHEKRGKKC